MAGLLDIGDISEDVALGRGGKTSLTVFGLTIEDIIYLVNSHKEVRALLERKVSELTGEELMKSGPKVLASLICCGTRDRYKDPKKFELAQKAAMKLSASDQLKVINKVMELTFPEGVGPFVKELWGLQDAFGKGSLPNTAELNGASEKTSPANVSGGLVMDEASKKRYQPRPVN